MPDPRYDVELERFGVLELSEIQTAIVAVPRAMVEGLLELQLNTLGLRDRAVIVITRVA